MKISICIPQYNRIEFLLKSLRIIQWQSYHDIEVVVSDDCSTDDTEMKIASLKNSYRYPLIYHRNERNLGYDANYRKCIELATGDYCLVIGNDDSLNSRDSIEYLVDFLKKSDLPEIGFCNFVEDQNRSLVISRAKITGVLGSGHSVAVRNYSNFSFVGGLIYRKSSFDKFNTDKHDGSVYAQMYLGCLMIASGCRLFSIEKPLVVKDLKGDEKQRKSYRDVVARKWKNYRRVDGGLPSVINVLISAFRDAGVLSQDVIFHIFERIHTITYAYWLLDYRTLGAFPEAVGMTQGMLPTRNKNFKLLSFGNKIKIILYYLAFTLIGLTMPLFIYVRIKNKLYSLFKQGGSVSRGKPEMAILPIE